MALVVIRPAPAPGPDPLTPALGTDSGPEVRPCDPWSGDPVPTGLGGIEGLVLAGDTPQALPLLRAALAAEVPVLALGGGAELLARAADADRTPADADPLLGGAGFRVGGSAWGLPAPPEGEGAGGLLGRFAALVAGRAEHTATRAFFTPRAEAWEERFAYQTPAYEAAVARMRLLPGQTALDLGCGSGRAMPALRSLVGETGTVLGVDLTPAMLTAAAQVGREGPGRLLLADCVRLPLASGAVHGIFAAGLLDHLPRPRTALAEWARVCAPGGELLLFHPSGRAERAARHGRPLSPDDPLAEPNLRPALESTGWHLTQYEDAPTHFLTHAHHP
ncbi:class I SAM-dependent methyltransferase [Streptomyces sp. NBC_00249]|uniref:class I SAM-dependent methyltransferase n=1 Tax=Streptomyces sp. NBC_00249 TaxID=2975690 RepID=UPI002252EE61|nr:class I SAM-dependent methyltransferase [Streptomyces sp. NBC_00249]MCX5193275.1 class I SAM-dependent methyltransferase [Streptomyces sp. NBC_00249]